MQSQPSFEASTCQILELPNGAIAKVQIVREFKADETPVVWVQFKRFRKDFGHSYDWWGLISGPSCCVVQADEQDLLLERFDLDELEAGGWAFLSAHGVRPNTWIRRE